MDILPLPTERLMGPGPLTVEEIAAYVVAAALHSQPLERAALREFIRTQLCDGSYPQLVLRLGTAIQTAVSVRRPPASGLFASGGEHLSISHG